MKNKINISIIVTLHNEGILAYKSLRNIAQSIENAFTNSISCELLIGLDRADEATTRVTTQFLSSLSTNVNHKVIQSDYGDLGLNRNNLISNSAGEYILIHDGDDFFTQNFLVEAYKMAAKSKQETAYVPQFLINFDAQHYMSYYFPSDSELISKQFFFETNYYTSQYLLPRAVFNTVKYEKTADGYGYEDWWLNTILLNRGIEFKIVPDTIFFYRRKKTGSLLAASNNDTVLIHKTPLFEPDNFLKLPSKVIEDVAVDDSIHGVPQLSPKDKLKSRLSRHQITYGYTRNIWQAHKLLARGLRERLSSGSAENDQPSQEVLDPYEIVNRNKTEIPQRMRDIGVTRTLISEWGRMNAIEPLIRASWDMFEYIPIVSYPTNSALSDAYDDFCQAYHKRQFDDLIFVPHMIRGGAELATIHLVSSLSRKGRKVLVVGVLDSESPWANRINEINGAVFVENRELLKHVPEEDKRLLFWVRIIQYWNIQTITTINSEFGYKFIHRYHRQLRAMNCKTYVHAYAYDVTEDGYIYNFIPNGLVEIYDSTTKYITDSAAFKSQLIEINGFEKGKVDTLYLPSDTTIAVKRDYRRKNRILFAGRIGYQKIADIAVEVGVILAKEGIELHFYGSIDEGYAKNDKFLKMIEPYPAIQYKGTFNGPQSLRYDDYDIFLLTTRTEGLPNAILEACCANIFIVSAAVGGLPETISQGRNGALVDDNDKFSPVKYAEVIMHTYNTGAYADREKIDTHNRQIKKRHSLQEYNKGVSTIMQLSE